jgi:hypothetical protein
MNPLWHNSASLLPAIKMRTKNEQMQHKHIPRATETEQKRCARSLGDARTRACSGTVSNPNRNYETKPIRSFVFNKSAMRKPIFSKSTKCDTVQPLIGFFRSVAKLSPSSHRPGLRPRPSPHPACSKRSQCKNTVRTQITLRQCYTPM